MIVDTSALISIAQGEQTSSLVKEPLLASRGTRISAANMLETWMVVDRRGGPDALPILEGVIAKINLRIEPVTPDQVKIARDAWARYGKGSGHPAQLNFGDCFAYALAKHTGEPLLFIGGDFIHTDVTSAISR
ncbi:MAG: type II toxin-antitoxin system VapC family toxin [Thermomicrobiales bacterium]